MIIRRGGHLHGHEKANLVELKGCDGPEQLQPGALHSILERRALGAPVHVEGLCAVAAWTRAGNATFFSSSHSSVESSFSRSQAGRDSDAQVVRTIDLAAYLRADFFAGASLRLLKIVSAAIAHRISSQGL